MRWEMGNEWYFFLLSFGQGAFRSFVFDLFRMLRRAFCWRVWEVAVQDLFYWSVAAFYGFLFLLEGSDGVPRWYVLFGWCVGWILWHLSVGKFLLFLWGKGVKAVRSCRNVLRKKAAERRAKRREKSAKKARERARKKALRSAKKQKEKDTRSAKREKRKNPQKKRKKTEKYAEKV